MYKAVGIRYTDYKQHPVTINLNFYRMRRSQYWEMDIISQGQRYGLIKVKINPQHLGQLNTLLREEMGKVLHHASIGGEFAKKESKTNLTSLAKAGQYVFSEVFEQSKAREIMLKLLSQEEGISIQVDSEDFSLPWELLYSEDLEDSGKPPLFENFWGMKYIISRVITPQGVPEPLTIQVANKPKLGLLTYETQALPDITKTEIPFFEKLKADGKINLIKLPGLDPTPANWSSELKTFKDFWDKAFDVAHFACHAEYVEKKQIQSFIQLSKGIRFTLYDLKGLKIKDYPLIILNACKTGRNNPMDVHYFAGDFIQYGALGVVATEAAVPDKLAAEFTRHLYKHLLKGEYLGQSVLLARQELLKSGNPVGLLYALYAPPVIKLEVRKKNHKKKV